MLERQCPVCGKKSLSNENPYGSVVCLSCGWMESEVQSLYSAMEILARVGRWSAIVGLVFVLVVLAVQLVLWGPHAFEVTYLQGRMLLGQETRENRLERGAICNSLKKHDCAVKIFTQLVEQNPMDRTALANLAINYVQTEKSEKAQPHFEAYFSLGGSGFDVMYWYAKSLRDLGELDRGRDWLYYSLVQNSEYESSAKELFHELVDDGRPYEATSLIGSLTSGKPEGSGHWNNLLARLYSKPIVSDEAKTIYHVPSLDRRYHYVPVQLKEQGRPRFFVLSPKEAYTLVDEDIVIENRLTIPEDAAVVEVSTLDGQKSARKVTLPYLKLGPWELGAQTVLVCRDCRSLIGEETLSDLKLDNWQRHHTQFYTLSSRKEIP